MRLRSVGGSTGGMTQGTRPDCTVRGLSGECHAESRLQRGAGALRLVAETEVAPTVGALGMMLF